MDESYSELCASELYASELRRMPHLPHDRPPTWQELAAHRARSLLPRELPSRRASPLAGLVDRNEAIGVAVHVAEVAVEYAVREAIEEQLRDPQVLATALAKLPTKTREQILVMHDALANAE